MFDAQHCTPPGAVRAWCDHHSLPNHDEPPPTVIGEVLAVAGFRDSTTSRSPHGGHGGRQPIRDRARHTLGVLAEFLPHTVSEFVNDDCRIDGQPKRGA